MTPEIAWPFVIAAYAITIGGTIGLAVWSFIALRRAEARAAAGRPDHIEAVSLLNEMYQSYNLEFVRVTGRVGQPLSFEPYDRPVIDDPLTEQAA